MSEPIVIEVDCIPMGKQRAKHARRGRFTVTYTPDKTVHFEEMLRYAAQKAMAGRPALDGPVVCDIEARFPLPKSATKAMRAAVEQEQPKGKAMRSSLRRRWLPSCPMRRHCASSLRSRPLRSARGWRCG